MILQVFSEKKKKILKYYYKESCYNTKTNKNKILKLILYYIYGGFYEVDEVELGYEK